MAPVGETAPGCDIIPEEKTSEKIAPGAISPSISAYSCGRDDPFRDRAARWYFLLKWQLRLLSFSRRQDEHHTTFFSIPQHSTFLPYNLRYYMSWRLLLRTNLAKIFPQKNCPHEDGSCSHDVPPRHLICFFSLLLVCVDILIFWALLTRVALDFLVHLEPASQ
ncbi:unnamed protein product [Ectocarpus sp. 13 AM-2016]